MSRYDLFDDARQQLELAFKAAADERAKRPGFDATSGELDWVIHERAVMLGAVNRIRGERGMEPVTEDEILAVERSAMGHIDYATKFALRCADLTVPVS